MTKIKIEKRYNTKGEIICAYDGCEQILTSPRSIRIGMGQRCYRKFRGLPWPLGPRDTSVNSVAFVESGSHKTRMWRYYEQSKLRDFE